MCGRGMFTSTMEEVRRWARAEGAKGRGCEGGGVDDGGGWEGRANVGPGTAVPVVVRRGWAEREVRLMRWGLVPSWMPADSRPDFFRMFNARGETVASKPVFSTLLHAKRDKQDTDAKRGRCLVSCDGFYEWLAVEDGPSRKKRKQPYLVRRKDGERLRLAGLWDTWAPARGGGDDEGPRDMETFTIVTVGASDQISWLHDRMPAVLPTFEDGERWLDGSSDTRDLLVPLDKALGELAWHPVDPAMSKLEVQGAQATDPWTPPRAGGDIRDAFGKGRKGVKREPPAPTPSSEAPSPSPKKRPTPEVSHGQRTLSAFFKPAPHPTGARKGGGDDEDIS